MRLPVAATHLSRVIHATSAGSLARALDEGRLVLRSGGGPDDAILSALRACAREEKAIADEARALAAARHWPTNLAGGAYGWDRLRDEVAGEALPRIVRILEREVFELESFARDPAADDDVRSLVLATADLKRSFKAELASFRPRATVPGAK